MTHLLKARLLFATSIGLAIAGTAFAMNGYFWLWKFCTAAFVISIIFCGRFYGLGRTQ